MADLINEVINQRDPYQSQTVATMRGRARPPMMAPPVNLPRVKAFEQQRAYADRTAGPETTARDEAGGAMALPRVIRPGYTPTQQLVSDATEFTGLPQLARGIGHIQEAASTPTIDPRGTAAIGDAIGEIAPLGLAFIPMGEELAGLPRMRAPTAHIPGQFPDGFLPFQGVPTGARQRTPFHTSFVGGSRDLMDAALPQRRAQAPDAGGAGGERGAPSAPRNEMDRLLHDPEARREHANAATVHQMTFADRPMTMYDFKDSPALTNVRFQPIGDGQTFTVAMSARGAEAGSPMSTKARVFADAISAIEHHAAQNNAAERGLRYLFTGETDAHTRLFRGIAERSTWPRGAVIHDTPAGFEVSFDPQRAPFSGKLSFNAFAHQPEYSPNLGQEGRLTLSDTINNRTRQIANGNTGTPQLPPDGGQAVGGPTAYRGLTRPFDAQAERDIQWHAANPETASRYAMRDDPELERGGGANVERSNINLGSRPLVVDARGASYLEIPTPPELSREIGSPTTTSGQLATVAQRSGFTGVHFRNLRDGITRGPGEDAYATFRRTQTPPTQGGAAPDPALPRRRSAPPHPRKS